MEKQDYTATITINRTAEEVFNSINNVSAWWSEEYEGQSTKLNDEFILKHIDRHYSKQKVVEVIPARKVVWLVKESKLNWIDKNKNEWTNTKMVFEISPQGEKTVLNFTHVGLVPEKECYSHSVQFWDMIITQRLYNFITNVKFLDMKNQNDFSYSLTVKATASETLEKISQVNLWWAKNFKGTASKLNDEFSVYFGDTYVNFRISEVIPDKKIVWQVTDCNLDWIEDKKEWNNTEVIWSLTQKEGTTKIDFVHKGMTPESECYETCKPGWTHHLKDSLQKLIDEGKGFPE